MADHHQETGFTLVELMLAIGILTVGITSLIGILSVGVSTRASADKQGRAILIADQIVHHIIENVFEAPKEGEPLLELQPLRLEAIEGYPGVRADVEFVEGGKEPGLILAKIQIAWLEQGQAVVERFRRILVRQETFPRRIAAKRNYR